MSTLILVGAGHVHQRLITQEAGWTASADRIVLIAPSSFRYGGAVTPMLAGHCDPARLRQSAQAVCQAAGVEYARQRVVGIEPRARRLWLGCGESMAFDAISLNVGHARLPQGWLAMDRPDGAPRLWSGISMSELARCRQALVAERAGAEVAVVGATQRAVEIAAGLSAAADLPDLRITLYLPASRAPGTAAARTAGRIARLLIARGVDIVTHTGIAAVAAQSVISHDGRRFRADHVIWAGESCAAALTLAAGRARDDRQRLVVDRRLSTGRGLDYLASGGCASLDGRVGLDPGDSARQASVLAHNLVAGQSAQAIRRYKLAPPQGAIDLGQGVGAVWRRGWHWPSRRLPRRIERERRAWLAEPPREPG